MFQVRLHILLSHHIVNPISVGFQTVKGAGRIFTSNVLKFKLCNFHSCLYDLKDEVHKCTLNMALSNVLKAEACDEHGSPLT